MRLGSVIYATGRFEHLPNGWEGAADGGHYDQVFYDAPSHSIAAQADAANNAIAEATAQLGAELDRVDVVWWRITDPDEQDAPTAVDDIQQLLEATTAANAFTPLLNAAAQSPTAVAETNWPSAFDWPRSWHQPEQHGPLTIACTRDSRSLLRLWYVRADSVDLDHYGPQLSDLLQTSTEQRRAPIAAYIAALGPCRHHLAISAADKAKLASHKAIVALERLDPLPIKALPTIAVITASLAAADHGLTTISLNLDRERAALAEALDQPTGSQSTTVGQPTQAHPHRWRFLALDETQNTEAKATTAYNSAWAKLLDTTHRDRRAHADSVAATNATKTVNRTMLLLTVAGGSVGAAQIPNATKDRILLAAAVALALLTIAAIMAHRSDSTR